MRVVSGTARGRKLVTVAGDAVRPSTDRVREAVFNALGSLGALQDAVVLDLFAGSGAMGIEALSRGARSCEFVDSSRASLDAVRENLEACGFTDRAQVSRVDAFAAAARSASFDLAILDPPYDFDRWGELLGVLDATTVVIESNRPVSLPSRWSVLRERTYGATVVTFAGSDPGRT